MDILLTPSLFEDYFKNVIKFPKTDLENDLISLINNPLNRFVLSKDYVTLLESNNSKGPLASVILPFLTDLINNRAVRVDSTGVKTEPDILYSVDTEYQAIQDAKKKDLFLVVSKEGLMEKKYTVDFNNIKKPNKNWLLLKICCHHPSPVVLRYYDFKDDNDIERLVELIFSLLKETDIYSILDKQSNFDHALFNSFKNISQIHYYTAFNTIQGNEQSFKDNFKKLKVFCSSPKSIHERKILRKNFILELDDDFWNINIKRTTWKMDITYCSLTSKKLIEKVKGFKRVILK